MGWGALRLWGCTICCAACTQTLDFESVSRGTPPYTGFRCTDLTEPPSLCDDYDAMQAPFAGWNATFQDHGSASVDTAVYLSPPASFLATSDAFELGVQDTRVRATTLLALDQLADTPLRMKVSFDVMAEGHDGSEGAWGTMFRFVYESEVNPILVDFDLLHRNGLVLALDEWEAAGEEAEPPGDAGVAEAAASDAGVPLPDPGASEGPMSGDNHGVLPGDPIVLNTWHHVEAWFDIREPEGFNNWFAINVNGEPRITADFVHPLYGGFPLVELGVVAVSDETKEPWRVRFDNVLVEVEIP